MFVVRTTGGERTEWETPYQATSALVAEIQRQRDGTEYESDEQRAEAIPEWHGALKPAEALDRTSHDGATELADPVAIGLPNGVTVTLTAHRVGEPERYPRKGRDGRSLYWGCCDSIIGPVCKHMQQL